MSKLALVVVNKYWECDAVLAALIGEASPRGLHHAWPNLQNWPRPRANPAPPPFSPRARALYSLGQTAIEVWCISDLLEDLTNEAKNQSSSEKKAGRLPQILSGRTPDLVIAVGTGASPVMSENRNGAVVVGSHVFAHNGDAANVDSKWKWTFDTVVRSSIKADQFRAITAIAGAAAPNLLSTPRNPGHQRAVIADADLVSLADVNVTDYSKFAAADLETVRAFSAADSGLLPASIETTHAVIRATLGASFMFVTGIVNRLGRLDSDVGGSGYNSAQNFAGAYNAGVAVAWMLPRLDQVL